MSTSPQSRKPVALITGGSRGIGLGIAESLAESGYRLAINGTRAEESVAEVIDGLKRRGTEAIYCRGNIDDGETRGHILESVRDSFGRIDLLVNNAGIAPRQRIDLLEATEASFDEVISVNLRAPYFLTQAVARWMIELRNREAGFRGTVINISSVSAVEASITRGEYCISKAGLTMATQLWAVRLAEFDIAVYEVRPGIIATDMTAEVNSKYDRLISDGLTLERRWGTPADVGRAVAMLARGDLTYATGNVLHVDGGLTVRRF